MLWIAWLSIVMESDLNICTRLSSATLNLVCLTSCRLTMWSEVDIFFTVYLLKKSFFWFAYNFYIQDDHGDSLSATCYLIDQLSACSLQLFWCLALTSKVSVQICPTFLKNVDISSEEKLSCLFSSTAIMRIGNWNSWCWFSSGVPLNHYGKMKT